MEFMAKIMAEQAWFFELRLRDKGGVYAGRYGE
jgi:hypothetical protein